MAGPHNRSWAHIADTWVARMIMLSIGALGAMLIAPKPVPMCRHITTFSSDRVRNTGPQYSSSW